MLVNINRPKLYIYCKQARHFLAWETTYWENNFELTDSPSKNTILLSFGPDALEDASELPALKRFAVLFPGFGHNPLYNLKIRKLHSMLISKYFEAVFINPGPLEIAYKDLKNIYFYPFSVDVKKVLLKKPRIKLDSLLHVSNNGAQKDWERSERIMKLTNLKYEVFPPRDDNILKSHIKRNEHKNKIRKVLGFSEKEHLPLGYVNHERVIKKYQQYDGFVHIARNIQDPYLIDGKYTASLIEAGITGAILFWHDTLNLGNTLETVFDLSLDEQTAAGEILRIRQSIDINKHSQWTSEEMLDTFNPEKSVQIRANKILEYL